MQNICPALLPLSKPAPIKTILKSFQPSLPKRDHNQSYGKMSARWSALFPAQTRYKEPSWHICSPFIGHYQVMYSLYIICWWLIFSLRPWSANMPISFLFFPFESGLVSFPAITYLPHVIDGEKDRGCWAAIKVYIIETSLTIGHRDKIQQWLEINVYRVYKVAIKKAREERE